MTGGPRTGGPRTGDPRTGGPRTGGSSSRRARVAALALALACATAGPAARAQTPPPGPPPAPAPAPPGAGAADSLSLYLKSLRDSTDAGFGTQSVAFDTTGLDSLAAGALTRPPSTRPRRRATSLAPIAHFHRAEGWVLGARERVGSPALGWLGVSGAYGFASHLGRYSVDWRRTLAAGARLDRAARRRQGSLDDRVARLDLALRYERATVPFMPEHASFGGTSLDTWVTGTDRQSVYERRGGSAVLTLWAGDVRLDAGVRHADEAPMPLVTRWSLFGEREDVPPNAAAARDRYTEPLAGLAFARDDWQLAAALDVRGGGGDRRRLHGVLGKGLRLGRSAKATLQVEGGAVPAHAPPQRRFELGGALALPSLAVGTGGTDHLLLGKLELVGSGDVLRAVGLRPPDWVVLQPLAFVQAGAAWDDAAGRDNVFVRVPREAWRGSVGAGVAYRLGFPDPSVMARATVAWPVGHDAGVVRLNAGIAASFDLIGRR